MKRILEGVLVFVSMVVMVLGTTYAARANHANLGSRDFATLGTVSAAPEIRFLFSHPQILSAPLSPPPHCAPEEVELEGWMIKKPDGTAVTDFVHFIGEDRCVAPYDPIGQNPTGLAWTWDQRDRNRQRVPLGTYLVEVVTAGTPAHDGIYGGFLTLVHRPDLVITDATILPEPDGSYTLTATALNRGRLAVRHVQIRFRANCSDPGSSSSSEFSLFAPTIVALGSMEEKTTTVRVKFDRSECALSWAEVDPYDKIRESNEENNIFIPPCEFCSIAAIPNPVLSFNSISPIGVGTTGNVSLDMSWKEVAPFSRRGFASYRLVVSVIGNAEIAAVNFVGLRGKAKIAKDKKSVLLSATDKQNLITEATEKAVLAQIQVRGTAAGAITLQVQVVQLIDDKKSAIDYGRRDGSLTVGRLSGTQISGRSVPQRIENTSLEEVESGSHEIRFVSIDKGVGEWRLSLFALTGARVFDSDSVKTLAELRQALNRSALASGAYLYVLSTRRDTDQLLRSHMGKIVIRR
jgi:hypothetical protein